MLQRYLSARSQLGALGLPGPPDPRFIWFKLVIVQAGGGRGHPRVECARGCAHPPVTPPYPPPPRRLGSRKASRGERWLTGERWQAFTTAFNDRDATFGNGLVIEGTNYEVHRSKPYSLLPNP